MEQQAALKILYIPRVLCEQGTQNGCQQLLPSTRREVVFCSILDIDMDYIYRSVFATSSGQNSAWNSPSKICNTLTSQS